jgi:hypothetical protein
MADDRNDPGTVDVATAELTRLVAPIGTAAEAAADGRLEPLFMLMNDMGLGEAVLGDAYAEVETAVRKIAGPWATIKTNLVVPLQNGTPPTPKQIDQVVSAVQELFAAVDDLRGLQVPDSTNAGEVPELVVDYLIVRYLEQHRPDCYAAFRLAGVIVTEESGQMATVDLGAFPDAIQNPTAIPESVLGWGTPGFKAYAVVYWLSTLLEQFGPATGVEGGEVFEVPPEQRDPDDPSTRLSRQLSAPLLSTRVGGTDLQLGSILTPIPAYGNRLPGLALIPYGTADFGKTFELGDEWDLSIDVTAEAMDWGLFAQPSDSGTDVGVRQLPPGDLPVDPERLASDSGDALTGLPDLHAEAELAYTGDDDGDRTVLIGSREGGGLYLNSLAARVILDAADDGPAFSAEFPASAELDVKPEGGFVTKVLPENFGSSFDLTPGYAPEKGLYVDAGATLEFPIPVHESLGPITLKEIYLALSLQTDPEGDAAPITITGAASASVKLGPIVGTVDRIGIEADVTFPGDNDGNLGPIDIDIGFKPPRGAGLSIAAGSAVTGGGYLFYDDEKERYGGTAQLKVPGGLSLSAVGLLTTRLPDGSDGFSLLVIIAGEFQPIPIGFGFTLNGVGGLLGINRRFRTKPLQNAVRTGGMQSVLFPKNVVENAQQIVSDLRSMFPPKRGTHLFGPMVKIGYGAPQTMALSLGIVLEIPSFRIAILGRMRAALPGLDVPAPPGLPEEAPYPPVQLNLDVVGIIDIPNERLSIDASLYDSRVMQWAVKGDMALRAKWGETSQFLVSLGGFHPAYSPPENVPDLERLTVALDIPGGVPKLTYKGYLAVTSNTFQVGAGVHAAVEKGELSISGRLRFDALFEFSPFKFRFDFLVAFRIESPAFTMAAGVDGRISGPGPMRIQGKAHLNPPALPKVSANFDVTLGTDAGSSELSAASVLPQLIDAFEEEKNWRAALPRDGESPISLAGAGKRASEPPSETDSAAERDGDRPPSPLEAHPLGTLQVSQGTVPLEYTIQKFGEGKPGTYNRFRIASVSVGEDGDERTQPVTGEFAPAKYTPMNQTQKLHSPDFVEKTAGVSIGDTGVFAGGEERAENATEARFIYEEQVYDRERNRRGETPADGNSNVGHSAHGAKRIVADRASPQTDTKGRFSVGDGSGAGDGGDDGGGGLFGVVDSEYVVIDRETFERVDTAIRSDAVETDEVAASGLVRDEAEDLARQLVGGGYVAESDVAVVRKEQFEGSAADSLTPEVGR